METTISTEESKRRTPRPPHAQLEAVHPFNPRPVPPGLESLVDLALDLRWRWSHSADWLWQQIDQRLWKATGSPWLILQTFSQDRLEKIAADPEIMANIARLARERAEYLRRQTWYGEASGRKPVGCVAYFSMEFGIGVGLPLYAGGLGVLAEDFLKGASDMGVPSVGVGLLYNEGYFRQLLDAEGCAKVQWQ
jgi:starch phosphorylase